MAYTWPITINGVAFAAADFSPFSYATTLPDLLGNFVAYAESQQASVQAGLAATYAAQAITAKQAAEAAVAGVTAGSTTALSFPAVDKVLATVADVVGVFVYDTRLDSDGGAWRTRCQHTSWWNETLNTATRGARRDFPMVALIVARSTTVTIYDALDLDPATGVPRMWMVFNAGTFAFATGSVVLATSPDLLSSVFAVQGRIYWGVTGVSLIGAFEADFVADQAFAWRSATTFGGRYRGGLASRNANLGYSGLYGPRGAIVNGDVRAIHARVLPGAPLDEAGLPIPTIAVATAAGVSVIHPSGVVYDVTSASACYGIRLDQHGTVRVASSGLIYNEVLPYADRAVSAADAYRPNAGTGVAGIRLPYAGSDPRAIALLPRDGLALGSIGPSAGFARGLGVLAEDLGNRSNGMISVSGLGFATGWQPGDIRMAALCGGTTGAIVGSGELVANGTFTTDTSGWAAGGGASIAAASGELRITATAAASQRADQTLTTVVGQTYVVKGTMYRGTAANSVLCYVNDGTSTLATATVSATSSTPFLFQFTATTTSTFLSCAIQGTPGAGDTAFFDNISVKLAVPDRSYKAKGLVVNGTLSRTVAATGTDLAAFSGFSAANYLEQPYNSDLDFGTGDFALIAWVKLTASGNTEDIFDRDSPSTGVYFKLGFGSTGLLTATLNNAGTQAAVSTVSLAGAGWTLVAFVRRGTSNEIWLNGERNSAASVGGAKDLNNTSAVLRIGLSPAGTNPATNTSICLPRITAYAPTAAQFRRMYEDEKALFGADAKAFLGGTSDSVQDLSYDESRRLLAVGTADGASIFSGLRRVAYHDASTLTALTSDDVNCIAAGAGILLFGSAAEAGVVQDAVVGKEAVLDHGPRRAGDRFRAFGVTTDATPLSLAPRVMIGERELVLVEARIVGRVYGAADSERLSYVRKATYYRDSGGNVTLQGSVQTIGTDTEQTAGADATLAIDTTPQTVTPSVTGVAATRIVWTADVTVTRYSEDRAYA